MAKSNRLPINLTPMTIAGLISSKEPFFGYLLSAITIKIGSFKGFPVAAASSKTIYLQQSFIDRVKQNGCLNELLFVVLHEIYHIYLNHCWRFGFHNGALYERYKDKATVLKTIINIVLDCIINKWLIDAGYDPGSLSAMTLDKVLGKDHPRVNDSWTEEELLAYVLNNNSISIKYIDDFDEDLAFDDEDSETEDRTEVIKEVKDKAINLLKNSDKKCGNLTNSIVKDDVTVVKSNDLSWEDRLKQLALIVTTNQCYVDYNSIVEHNFYPHQMGLSPFNRCPIEYNYKPKPTPDTVALYLDLSGSIFCCDDLLGRFLDQISQIARAVGNLLLVTFDYGPKGAFMFDMSSIETDLGSYILADKDTYLQGGGGTDVIPLFEAFFEGYKDLNVDVNVDHICMTIVLTDLYLQKVDKTLEPKNVRGNIPTIWVVPKEEHSSQEVDFGEILLIN